MPELPDITIYIEALESRLLNQRLEKIRLGNPFLVRTFEPPIGSAEGNKVVGFQRIGKRIVFELEGELFLVFHLMITGRFHWKKRGIAVPRKYGHAAFDFPKATLLLTEMGTKKRASLHLVQGREHLQEHDPGGLEIFTADLAAFRAVLTRENHTLKRTLTDPHVFSGIGNAYSDEILHRAKLSPVKQTKLVSDDVIDVSILNLELRRKGFICPGCLSPIHMSVGRVARTRNAPVLPRRGIVVQVLIQLFRVSWRMQNDWGTVAESINAKIEE